MKSTMIKRSLINNCSEKNLIDDKAICWQVFPFQSSRVSSKEPYHLGLCGNYFSNTSTVAQVKGSNLQQPILI